MTICGSSTDFLGKLIYEPQGDEDATHYCTIFLLTSGSFFICSFALFTVEATTCVHQLLASKCLPSVLLALCIPSLLDLIVTSGRFLGLLFLFAASISILKNG